ncbi:phage tail assembly protein [Spirulina subsalsa FACHB-351]|uniref:Phage tail assembly protein n=1 Tax=Spirulina subsalsa FACHB-351 TaxID=234711 RepID=A0ABT3L5Q5_9CYAN|nr:phage tail assembly protein [Spirulina subsalsa]MCW6036831.1 phage tail assembly protein [Spirulina subsalsa FACHB-351]
MWKPAPHPLRWPLTVADETLTALPLRPILHGEHADLIARMEAHKAEQAAQGKPLDDDEYDNQVFLALAVLTTGLDEKTLLKLKRPDFNGLAQRVFELVSAKSTAFMDADMQARASDPDAPPLLVPIKCSDGITRDAITLEVPDLEATQLMRKYTDRRQRAEFITAKCTGLMVQDLAQLTAPDWNTLQARLNDFLNMTGDFFRLGTSTS